MNRKNKAKEIIERDKRFTGYLNLGIKLQHIPDEDKVWEWEVIEYSDEIQELLK